MKKLIIILICFLVTLSMRSQTMQYGFGLSFSNLKNADQDTSNNAEYKPLVGINLSFSSISNLNERISLVSEFAFTQKGYSRFYDYGIIDSSMVQWEYKTNESFLQFTQLFEFHFIEKLSLSFGPYLEYLLEGRYILRDEEGNDIYNQKFTDLYVNGYDEVSFGERFNYGVNLAASYKIYENLFFRLGYSMTNILNNDSNVNFNKINSLFLNLSLKIDLNR